MKKSAKQILGQDFEFALDQFASIYFNPSLDKIEKSYEYSEFFEGWGLDDDYLKEFVSELKK